jgi:hypothetical protein
LYLVVLHPIQNEDFYPRLRIKRVPVPEGSYWWEVVLRGQGTFHDVPKNSRIHYLEAMCLASLSSSPTLVA